MVERCTRLFGEIWRRALEDMVDQQYYQIDPSRLTSQLNSELGLVLSGVDDWAGRKATAIQRDCAKKWQLSMQAPELGRLTGISVVDLPRFSVLEERIRYETHRTKVKRIRTGEHYETTTGAKPGLIRRALVKGAGLFGESARASAAKATGVRIVQDYEEIGGEKYKVAVNDGYSATELAERRAQLQEAVSKARARSAQLIEESVTEHVNVLAAAVALEMEQEIALETETLGRVLPELEAAAVRTRESAQARLAELEALTRPLRAHRHRAEQLAREVDELTKAAS
ncbi:hypothetical protein ACFQ9X_35360 [Catenulispora yoronensis]